mmetsp:Transcript_7393/g.16807  ORF Transcript_7393/g.16807 Transcript_7393/m.16807 type:complete len:135 (+) Transcript_7393:204-608(+)
MELYGDNVGMCKEGLGATPGSSGTGTLTESNNLRGVGGFASRARLTTTGGTLREGSTPGEGSIETAATGGDSDKEEVSLVVVVAVASAMTDGGTFMRTESLAAGLGWTDDDGVLVVVDTTAAADCNNQGCGGIP